MAVILEIPGGPDLGNPWGTAVSTQWRAAYCRQPLTQEGVSLVPDLTSLASEIAVDYDRPTEFLDILLEEVCIALQLSDSQFNLAEQRYHAIGDWLGAEGSALAHL